MKRTVTAFILLLVIPLVYADINISEIMFNPKEGNEWVELLVSNATNISGLTLTDNYYTDDIVCCDFDLSCGLILPKNTFIVIFDQDTTFNFSNLEHFYCVDDNTIGNGLGNSNDQVIVSKQGIVLSNLTYTKPVEKGNSLSLINGTWVETSPTPGKPNKVIEDIPIKINSIDIVVLENLPMNLFTDTQYNLFKIKNLDYPNINEKIDVTFYYNISRLINDSFKQLTEGITNPSLNFYTTKNTGQFIFKEAGKYLACGKILNSTLFDYNTENNVLCLPYNVLSWQNISCNVSLSINIEKQIYVPGEKVGFYNKLSNDSFPFKIEYWVEDLFGNKVKNKVSTSNENKKTYTPKPGNAYLLKNKLTWIACNNFNNKTSNEKSFVVKGQIDKSSKIEIKKLYSNRVSFGDLVRIKIKVYKGDTTKNSLKAYVEKSGKRISYTTYFNLYEKFHDYELTIPLQLKSNCNNKYKAADYYVYVEGLDEKIRKRIIVKGHKKGLCGSTAVTKEDAPIEKTTIKLYELLNYTFNKTNKKIILKLNINNPTKHNHTYSVWSYIYKGPVSFSGHREKNKINISLSKTSKKTIILENTLFNISPGDYKLKIKILRDDRKTPYEITENLYLNASSLKVNEIMERELDNIMKTIPATTILNKSNKITSNVVYASSSEKAKTYTLFFLFFIVFLVSYAWYKTR